MKKKKIWTSMSVWLASFLFISSWVVFGVALALKTTNVGLNGNVTFTATGVYAKVSGSVTGTATTNTLNDISIDASTTNASQSWDDVNFDFKDENTPIVTTITVENLSDERSIWLTFYETISVTNITLARTADGSSVDAFSTIEIPTSSSKSFTITMKVDDKNKNVSGLFNFNVELSNSQLPLDQSAYSNLVFYKEYRGGVSVAANQDNPPTGHLIIPSKVLIDGEEKAVTEIGGNALGQHGTAFNITSIYIPASVTTIDTNGLASVLSCSLAYFEDPEGWQYGVSDYNSETDSYDYTWTDVSLSDPSNAATVVSRVNWEDWMRKVN